MVYSVEAHDLSTGNGSYREQPQHSRPPAHVPVSEELVGLVAHCDNGRARVVEDGRGQRGLAYSRVVVPCQSVPVGCGIFFFFIS